MVKTRFFQFSIRELAILTVAIALAIGWFIEHQKAKRLLDELEMRRAASQFRLQYQSPVLFHGSNGDLPQYYDQRLIDELQKWQASLDNSR